MNKLIFLTPLCILLALLAMTAMQRLTQKVELAEGQPLPAFAFIQLQPNKPLNNTKIITNTYGLPQDVFLINFFGSWCVSCRLQHETLLNLMQKEHVSIIGFAVRDNEKDINRMIKSKGNPYIKIALVPESHNLREKWDVISTPTTFIVDGTGMIRYRYDKIMSPADAKAIILPIIEQIKLKKKK